MTRKKDGRSYITVHDDAMDHPKIEAMSDTAIVHWLRLMGWCNRHRTDGMVPLQKMRAKGPKVFEQLTTELVPGAGAMFELQPDGRYYAHDYLNHQWSRAEIEAQADTKAASGTFGSHKRWHVARGITDPSCGHCSQAQTG